MYKIALDPLGCQSYYTFNATHMTSTHTSTHAFTEALRPGRVTWDGSTPRWLLQSLHFDPVFYEDGHSIDDENSVGVIVIPTRTNGRAESEVTRASDGTATVENDPADPPQVLGRQEAGQSLGMAMSEDSVATSKANFDKLTTWLQRRRPILSDMSKLGKDAVISLGLGRSVGLTIDEKGEVTGRPLHPDERKWLNPSHGEKTAPLVLVWHDRRASLPTAADTEGLDVDVQE